jgi:hypothetical protein
MLRFNSQIIEFFAIFFLIFFVATSSQASVFEECEGINKDDQRANEDVCRFNKALKIGDKKLIAETLSYPIRRIQPLPSIKNSAEFVEHYDEFFDEENIEKILKATNSPRSFELMGWRGYMALDGILWTQGEGWGISISNLHTKKQEELARIAKEKDKAEIHPSASKYESIALECFTSKYHIRIHEIDAKNSNEVKYFSWKKDRSISSVPEIALKGSVLIEGSGGYRTFSFKSGAVEYEISELGITDEETGFHRNLTVTKNGKIILVDACKKEDGL